MIEVESKECDVRICWFLVRAECSLRLGLVCEMERNLPFCSDA